MKSNNAKMRGRIKNSKVPCTCCNDNSGPERAQEKRLLKKEIIEELNEQI